MPAAPVWRFASKQWSFLTFWLDCQSRTLIFSKCSSCVCCLRQSGVGLLCIFRREERWNTLLTYMSGTVNAQYYIAFSIYIECLTLYLTVGCKLLMVMFDTNALAYANKICSMLWDGGKSNMSAEFYSAIYESKHLCICLGNAGRLV